MVKQALRKLFRPTVQVPALRVPFGNQNLGGCTAHVMESWENRAPGQTIYVTSPHQLAAIAAIAEEHGWVFSPFSVLGPPFPRVTFAEFIADPKVGVLA